MIFVSVVSMMVSFQASAAVYRGAVGFDQNPGTLTILNSGNIVRAHADGAACTMEFGPIIGTNEAGGYELAVRNTCGEKEGRVFLYYREGGRPQVLKKFGRSGSYIFL